MVLRVAVWCGVVWCGIVVYHGAVECRADIHITLHIIYTPLFLLKYPTQFTIGRHRCAADVRIRN